MFPDDRVYINLIELSQALDYQGKPFIHKGIDLFSLHINKNMHFYFYIDAVLGGGELYELNSNNNWEIYEYKRDEESLKKFGFKDDEIEEIHQYEENKLLSETKNYPIKYIPAINDKTVIKAIIGAFPAGIDISRESLLDYQDRNLRIRLPYGLVRIQDKLFMLKSKMNLSHEPINKRINLENRTIRKIDPDYKIRKPYLEINCKNVLVKVEELKNIINKTEVIKESSEFGVEKEAWDSINNQIKWCNDKFMEYYSKDYPNIPSGGFTTVGHEWAEKFNLKIGTFNRERLPKLKKEYKLISLRKTR